MRLSQAIDGFMLFKTGEGLSPRTLALYGYHLKQLQMWSSDPPLDELDQAAIAAFLIYLREEYRPTRSGGDTSPLSSQSIYNAWTALRSFYRWAAGALDAPSPMAGIPRPKVRNEEQAPFTQDEVKRLLAAVKPVKAKRPLSGKRYLDALRDRAVIMVLLDTGLRAGELCALKIGDAHLASGRLSIHGKGGKSRQVFLGAHSRPALWRYLQERPDDPAAPLFVANGRPLTRSALYKRLIVIGRSVNIPECRPHRFRYTFAIQYLRNGGDIFTLQALLGHSSMKMVSYYLKLASADVEQAHKRASPVDNWLK